MIDRLPAPGWLAALAGTAALALTTLAPNPAAAEVQPSALGSFVITQEVEVPGTSEEAYDGFTGDITVWWDHSFSEKPLRIVLEPRPGGGFYELFDDQGNGALYATVNFAQRGQRIRFTGSMGYSGFAVEMVHTVNFYPGSQEGTTRVVLTVRAAGELDPDWPEGIDRVWKHFLEERYKLFMEAVQAARRQQQEQQGQQEEQAPPAASQEEPQGGAEGGGAPPP